MAGFNSFLPAPKRPAAASGGSSIGGISRGGLGSGVSLKTGATPAFSREPAPNVDESTGGDEGAEVGSVLEIQGPVEAPLPTDMGLATPTSKIRT